MVDACGDMGRGTWIIDEGATLAVCVWASKMKMRRSGCWELGSLLILLAIPAASDGPSAVGRDGKDSNAGRSKGLKPNNI